VRCLLVRFPHGRLRVISQSVRTRSRSEAGNAFASNLHDEQAAQQKEKKKKANETTFLQPRGGAFCPETEKREGICARYPCLRRRFTDRIGFSGTRSAACGSRDVSAPQDVPSAASWDNPDVSRDARSVLRARNVPRSSWVSNSASFTALARSARGYPHLEDDASTPDQDLMTVGPVTTAEHAANPPRAPFRRKRTIPSCNPLTN